MFQVTTQRMNSVTEILSKPLTLALEIRGCVRYHQKPWLYGLIDNRVQWWQMTVKPYKIHL